MPVTGSSRQVPDPLEALGPLARPVSYHRDEEIYGPEGPAEHWYRVVCGMAREFALLRDGRRQIVDFLFPGDLFGFVNQYQQVLAVEAVTDGAVVPATRAGGSRC